MIFLYIVQKTKANCAHILRKVQTIIVNLWVQSNELLTNIIFFFQKHSLQLMIENLLFFNLCT